MVQSITAKHTSLFWGGVDESRSDTAASQRAKDNVSADFALCWANLNLAQPPSPVKNLETFPACPRPQGAGHPLESTGSGYL